MLENKLLERLCNTSTGGIKEIKRVCEKMDTADVSELERTLRGMIYEKRLGRICNRLGLKGEDIKEAEQVLIELKIEPNNAVLERLEQMIADSGIKDIEGLKDELKRLVFRRVADQIQLEGSPGLDQVLKEAGVEKVEELGLTLADLGIDDIKEVQLKLDDSDDEDVEYAFGELRKILVSWNKAEDKKDPVKGPDQIYSWLNTLDAIRHGPFPGLPWHANVAKELPSIKKGNLDERIKFCLDNALFEFLFFLLVEKFHNTEEMKAIREKHGIKVDKIAIVALKLPPGVAKMVTDSPEDKEAIVGLYKKGEKVDLETEILYLQKKIAMKAMDSPGALVPEVQRSLLGLLSAKELVDLKEGCLKNRFPDAKNVIWLFELTDLEITLEDVMAFFESEKDGFGESMLLLSWLAKAAGKMSWEDKLRAANHLTEKILDRCLHFIREGRIARQQQGQCVNMAIETCKIACDVEQRPARKLHELKLRLMAYYIGIFDIVSARNVDKQIRCGIFSKSNRDGVFNLIHIYFDEINAFDPRKVSTYFADLSAERRPSQGAICKLARKYIDWYQYPEAFVILRIKPFGVAENEIGKFIKKQLSLLITRCLTKKDPGMKPGDISTLVEEITKYCDSPIGYDQLARIAGVTKGLVDENYAEKLKEWVRNWLKKLFVKDTNVAKENISTKEKFSDMGLDPEALKGFFQKFRTWYFAKPWPKVNELMEYENIEKLAEFLVNERQGDMEQCQKDQGDD